MKIDLQSSRPGSEKHVSEYVVGPYHSEEIRGMDSCLRKQLIVTCSASYVCIWNYADRKFVMAWRAPFGEEANAVAFHPSGFHLLVAVGDKVLMMNVLSDKLAEYNNFVLKGCREIRFAHGGHLFACGNNNFTNVYDFFTMECTKEMYCKGHSGKIKNIDWWLDDTGFTDCCNAGQVSYYDLQ